MRSTFKLLYFVKWNAVKKNGNAPIIARITIDQVVAQFNTKLEINPAHWSVELGKASGRTAEAVHINSMLESIRSTVHQHYHALMAQNGYVTAELVKNAFLDKIARERTLILQTAQRAVFAKGQNKYHRQNLFTLWTDKETVYRVYEVQVLRFRHAHKRYKCGIHWRFPAVYQEQLRM